MIVACLLLEVPVTQLCFWDRDGYVCLYKAGTFLSGITHIGEIAMVTETALVACRGDAQNINNITAVASGLRLEEVKVHLNFKYITERLVLIYFLMVEYVNKYLLLSSNKRHAAFPGWAGNL